MIAVQAQIISGANLIPSGPRAAVTIHAAADMFAHAGQLCEGSDDGTLATPGRGRWEFAASMCGRRPIRRIPNKKPAADFSAQALQFS